MYDKPCKLTTKSLTDDELYLMCAHFLRRRIYVEQGIVEI